jgi:hypothetical protein
MNWIEVIHLRITERETEKFVPIVQQLVGEAVEDRSCREVKMYRRALVDTDLSIILYHDTLKMEKNGSSLGLRITSALKEFGMVNHITWLEIHSS